MSPYFNRLFCGVLALLAHVAHAQQQFCLGSAQVCYIRPDGNINCFVATETEIHPVSWPNPGSYQQISCWLTTLCAITTGTRAILIVCLEEGHLLNSTFLTVFLSQSSCVLGHKCKPSRWYSFRYCTRRDTHL